MNNSATAPPGSSGSPPDVRAGGVRDVRAVLDALLDADPSGADHDELDELIAAAARIGGWLDVFNVRCARRGRELADAGHAASPTTLLGNGGNRSAKEAARIEARTTALDALAAGTVDPGSGISPAAVGVDDPFERALLDGQISNGHVDAVADAMRRLDADATDEFVQHVPQLLAAACTERVETFARRCRALASRIMAAQATSDADELDRQRANSSVRRWVDTITGMHKTLLELDPLSDAALWSVIDASLATIVQHDGNAKTPWKRMQVDAVLAAVEPAAVRMRTSTSGASTSGRSADGTSDEAAASDAAADALHERRIPEITIHTDLRTLTDGLHEHGICETENGVPLPVSTVRRLCCDAEIIPVILGTDGVPLDMGRSVRTANRQQRRALRSMYRTCGHPDCTVGFSDCKAHHVRWWWRDLGPTDIDNLIPLCERHHHLVHEGGWELTMTPDRVTTWTRPDGTVHWTGPTADRIEPPPGRTA